MNSKKPNFMWSEGISKKSFKSKIYILKNLLVYTWYVTHRKTHFISTKGVPEEHFNIKDLDINNHY